ncbi:MAG: leucine-rich repeat domain-containing protein, partial [Bacteroidales bacterium]|nr:leucine-rich repeat domain-containing protein [Bacteroidales bacterium]
GRDILFYMGSDGILSSFQGNSALEILTIGEKVTAISDYSFYECPNITAITVKNPKPPIIGNGTHKAFEDGIKSTCKRTANNFKVQFKLSKIELEFLEQIVGHLDKKK